MGCWNETCALTNLPIHEGDKVVLVPVYDHQMTGLPIRGEYNDYGMIENITNPNIAEIFKLQVEDGVKRGVCKITDDDHYKGRTTPEDILLLAERGLINDESIRYEGDRPRRMYFIMMHESAFDAVVRNAGQRVPYEADYNMRESYSYSLDKIVDDMTEYTTNKKEHEIRLDRLDKILAEMKDEDVASSSLKELMTEQSDLAVKMMRLSFSAQSNFRDKLGRWFGDAHSGYGGSLNSAFIPEYYTANKTDEIKKAILELVMIKYVFEVARIPIVCGISKGCQQSEHRIHMILAEQVKDIAKTYQYKYDGVFCDNCSYQNLKTQKCDGDHINDDGQCKSFESDTWGEESANDPKRWLM